MIVRGTVVSLADHARARAAVADALDAWPACTECERAPATWVERYPKGGLEMALYACDGCRGGALVRGISLAELPRAPIIRWLQKSPGAASAAFEGQEKRNG